MAELTLDNEVVEPVEALLNAQGSWLDFTTFRIVDVSYGQPYEARGRLIRRIQSNRHNLVATQLLHAAVLLLVPIDPRGLQLKRVDCWCLAICRRLRRAPRAC